jgi:uncharacterized protein (TIGR02145 family)
MIRIFTILLVVLLSVSSWAQAPQSFSYQAVIRGINNSLISNKPVGMKISLLQGSENGNGVYVETHQPMSNENGLVSIAIGNGKVEKGTFLTIDWSKGPFFVKTETDPSGGSNYVLTTTNQLLSVPYSLSSNNGISRVSETGDSLILSNGNFVIIPGLSIANPKPKPTSGYGSNITDTEGNTYKTVYIGTQQWMADNLKVSKYSDGTIIPNVTDNITWCNLTNGAWAYYNNDQANNTKYGKLYNLYSVSKTTNGNMNVCPTGWHVPTNTEWNVLIDYLGGKSVAGGKLKEVGTNSWVFPNTDANNNSLFTGIPGGLRGYDGSFVKYGEYGVFWSTDGNFTIVNFGGGVYYDGIDLNKVGCSIRCLKD